MGEYKFKGKVDKEKVFIVQKSRISERLDPDMIKYNSEISHFKFPLISLGRLLTKSPQYGANEAGIIRDNSETPRYIRITDIDEDGFLSDELGKTASKIEKQYFLENNDILFARSGNTVGKSYIHKSLKQNYKCFFAGYMIRFIVDSDKIIPDFLFCYTQLNPYKRWVKAIQRTAGQPNINAEEYKSLKIPVPPLETQQKIVNQYQQAYNDKQQKEKEAKKILASIDTYLLNELGITLPVMENSLESRVFTVNFSEVSGERFESQYYTKYNRELIDNINSGKYELTTIKSQCEFIPGYAFSSSNYVDKSDCLLITIKNITKNTVDIVNTTYLPSNFYDEYFRFRINKEDLLIAMTGATIGKVGIYESENKALLNQRNGIIKSTKMNTYYLMNLLNTDAYQSIILKNSVGGAQPNISETDITRIKIPIPPLEKQNEIAIHISEIRAKAKQLKTEAKTGLENAKQEIEKLILGTE